jgi:hypothetical protein
MKSYGNLNDNPMDTETQMELGMSRMMAQPEVDMPVGGVPLNLPTMAESQMQLDLPSLDPATGNQKQPIVKQFNPDARLGGGAAGNVKRPIQTSRSRK